MKKNQIYFLLTISLLAVSNVLHANQIIVPTDYSTIQGAIDNSVNGDTIIIQNGTYSENIDFKGKEIVLGSQYLLNNQVNYVDSVVIDGQNAESVVKFVTSETNDSKLFGVTLINGYAGDGGGIKCSNSSPTIENVKIQNCTSTNWGGGLFISGGSPIINNMNLTLNVNGAVMIREGANPTIHDMTIDNNSGDAIFFYATDATINNLIVINSHDYTHSCFGFNSSSPEINNALIVNNVGENLFSLTNACDVLVNFATIYGNTSNTFIWTTEASSKINVTNSIVWNNTYSTINEYPNTITITNTNFEGGYSGTNNISAEPEFNNVDSLDFSLTYSSPCIGIGDVTGAPQYDIVNSLRPYPSCTNPDIGAYENVLGISIDKIYVYDTLTVNDTINVFDTTFVNVYDTIVIYDTLPVFDSITVAINDTIKIYDTITVYDTISVTDTLFIDVTFTDIQSLENEVIKVYPNPAKELLFIDFGVLYSELFDYKINIINSVGTTVYTSEITQSRIEINLQDFGNTGLYYLQIIKKPDLIMDVRKIILE